MLTHDVKIMHQLYY